MLAEGVLRPCDRCGRAQCGTPHNLATAIANGNVAVAPVAAVVEREHPGARGLLCDPTAGPGSTAQEGGER